MTLPHQRNDTCFSSVFVERYPRLEFDRTHGFLNDETSAHQVPHCVAVVLCLKSHNQLLLIGQGEACLRIIALSPAAGCAVQLSASSRTSHGWLLGDCIGYIAFAPEQRLSKQSQQLYQRNHKLLVGSGLRDLLAMQVLQLTYFWEY